MRRRPQRELIACLLAGLPAGLLVGGCSGDDRPEPPRTPPAVTFSFAQWLPDEGTDRALLRVTNDSEEPLPVTGAGLRWSGYGDFVDPQDSTLDPGQTLDLRVVLPAGRCSEGQEPIAGVVATPSGEVSEELTENAQQFLRHLWQRRCEAELVHDQVAISYGDDWRLQTRSRGSFVTGSLLLERQDGREPVAALGASGSVLYDVVLDRPVVAAPDRPVTRVRLRILPGTRCDEHARGQATAPYTFRVTLRVAGTTTPVLVPPPPRVQVLATVALDRTCRQRATG